MGGYVLLFFVLGCGLTNGFAGKIMEIRHGKKEVREMTKGSECGIKLDRFEDIWQGDRLQMVEEVRSKRTLNGRVE